MQVLTRGHWLQTERCRTRTFPSRGCSMCTKARIYWGGDTLLSSSLSPLMVKSWLGTGKGYGKSVLKIFKEHFSNACYPSEILRTWRGSFVKSKLSLGCIRRIPCILGSLIYVLACPSLMWQALLWLFAQCPLWFGLRGIPWPHCLSYLQLLPKDNSLWKLILLCLWSSLKCQGSVSEGE